ncbi:MAG: Rpn family recombination-promoting nuclease/putative transposase [Spirochaetaceae bacterium]|jgi:predicted transposase/invertase (TIGR01784 family)|nr:Rpn family recombination-promoting nuclease/putative transposase [Spirochaetaceae bacterium]
MTAKKLRILNDFAFKKVFGEKGDETQLIAFLNAALNRKPENQIVSIEIIENKELPADFLGGKTSKLDIRAALADGTRVNIEIQLKNEYNMGRRSLRYWAMEYTRGIVEGQDYIDLPSVIVINILDFGLLPLDEFHTSFHIWEDTHKDFMLTDALEMHFLDIVKWRRQKERDYTNPMHRWMAYFDWQSPPELIEEVKRMDTAIRTADSRLEMIRNDPDFTHAYDMYELTRIDYKLGMQGARLDGLKEGKDLGLKEGKDLGLKEVARKMKNLNMPPEQITECTGLSGDEIMKL